jgi:hypothetical protein
MSVTITDGQWCNDMQCHVIDIAFDNATNQVRYQLAPLNAPDMAGTIKRTFKAMPNAKSIVVLAPQKPTVIYQKQGQKWHSKRAV